MRTNENIDIAGKNITLIQTENMQISVVLIKSIVFYLFH